MRGICWYSLVLSRCGVERRFFSGIFAFFISREVSGELFIFLYFEFLSVIRGR